VSSRHRRALSWTLYIAHLPLCMAATHSLYACNSLFMPYWATISTQLCLVAIAKPNRELSIYHNCLSVWLQPTLCTAATHCVCATGQSLPHTSVSSPSPSYHKLSTYHNCLCIWLQPTLHTTATHCIMRYRAIVTTHLRHVTVAKPYRGLYITHMPVNVVEPVSIYGCN